MWTLSASAYQRFSTILTTDGHVAVDAAYSNWNVYNGGDGISADGLTIGLYGNNPAVLEDSLLIKQQCPAITINPTALSNSVVASPYSQTVSASGGLAVYTYALTSGRLPAGLFFNELTGAITGTPTSGNGTGTPLTIRATDANGCYGTRVLSLKICPVIAVSPVALIGGTVGTVYSQKVTVGGGASPYTYNVSAGALPTWAILNSTTGVITGTPISVTAASFTIQAMDANLCSGTRAFTIAPVCPVISIIPTIAVHGSVGTAYSQSLSASGGTSPYNSWTLTAGTLPAGLTLNSATGLISGTPTAMASQSANLTMRVTDSLGCQATQVVTLPICPVMTMSPPSLVNAVVGTAYSQTVSATGGSSPYVFTIAAGALPAWASLNATTGVIAGMPNSTTTASFAVQTKDAFNCTGTRAYTLTITCPSVTSSSVSLSDAHYNLAYSQALTATGGTGPYAWSIVNGTPPSGITLSSAGVLNGTSMAFGSASFGVRVVDVYGCQSTFNTTLTVKGLAIGDLVWDDVNYNGIHEAGEAGVKEVTVQLWDPGADDAIGGTGLDADLQVGADKTTSAFGTFAFQNLLPGHYYLRVFPPANLPLPGGSAVDADNGLDNDNNSAHQPEGSGTMIYGPVVELSTGSETMDEDGDHDTDFSMDFGLYRGLTIGNPGTPNYVWEDANDNGIRNSGESGIDGVFVQLWFAGADHRIGGSDDALSQTTTSSGGGKYSFVSLLPGKYYLRIPTTPQAQPLSSSSSVLLDNGVNDDDNGHQVAAGSIYSPLITLTSGQEAGDGGYNENTIDFGLIPVTPTIYLSATQDDSIQTYNAASGKYTGALRHPFGASHNQGDGNPFDVPYSLELGPDGNWYVAHFGDSNLYRLSPTGIQTAGVLNASAASLSQIQVFAIGPDGNFYVVDHNGGRMVRFAGPLSDDPGVPIGTNPFTFLTQSGIQDVAFGPDGNLYLVVQTGATREIRRYNATNGALMNVVATDSQIVAMAFGGQPVSLVSGIDIHGSTLYGVNRSDGEIFRINLTDPSAPGAPQIVASIASAGKGDVDTRDIEYNPKDDQLYVTGYHWGKPVVAGTYSSGAMLRVSLTGTVDIFESPIPTPPGPNNEIWAGPRDISIGKPFSLVTETVAVGSLVWNDANANGIHEGGENGIPNVRVELWRDNDGNSSNGAESRIGWTFTNSRGMYYFSGEDPGVYQLKVSSHNFMDGQPLAGSGHSSPMTVSSDNQIDGDDNGIQTGGLRTETVSPLITLTPGAEPQGNGATGVELGMGGELDNYIVDASGDMTVDFGFVEPGIMALGNLVFNDANGNRRFDNGEGLDGAAVQLYYWGQTPGASQPLATTVTSNGGKYFFNSLWQGQYFMHLPAAEFQSAGDLRGLFSLQDVQAGDDDVGEDSIDALTPFTSGLSTGRIIMTRDSVPTNATGESGVDAMSDDSNDNNTDLTVDFGLFRPVAIGNLVFFDGNANGHADSGEGINGVTVQLYTHEQIPGTDTPMATTTTSNDGKYLFSFLRPGNYRLHIPSAMFQEGAVLFRRVSIDEGLSGDDDSGEDGLNDTIPSQQGVSTNIVTIFPGASPTDQSGESGVDSASDNDNDASFDLTVDFGFQTPVGIGNLVFIDADQNGRADDGEGVDDVTVEIYSADQIPGSVTPLFIQSTQNGGKYAFNFLSSGSYIVFIPASQFSAGQPLNGVVSMSGSQNSTADDDAGEDGIDDAAPSINGIRSRNISLNVDSAAVDAGNESGLFKTDDSFDDDNFDLTIDFGFVPSNPNLVGVGNLVYADANGNGAYDIGEGANGVTVQLFRSLADPQTAQPMRSVITANEGVYLFSGLDAGDYIIHIPASQFGTGKPLNGWASMVGQGGDNQIDDNTDQNGGGQGLPDVIGVTSTVISLLPDSEPQNVFGESGRDAFMDDANDDNTDLTVDFAFFKPVAVGNLVFLDANHNGRAESSEGLAGVEIQLFDAGDSTVFDQPLFTTATDSSGRYLFENLMAGSYFIHVPPAMFTIGAPLYLHASVADVQSGDDNLGEDGIDEGRPNAYGVSTGAFTLTPTGSPMGSTETGLSGASDDTADAATDLTLDLGFVLRVQIGNLVFRDANSDGVFDPNIERGIDGVTVELWSGQANAMSPLATTTTLNGGLYSFGIAPGTYHIRIPASAFGSGGAAENLVDTPPTANISGLSADDDAGQDGYSVSSIVSSHGVCTANFTVLPGLTPDNTHGETGFLSYEDDTFEYDSDLTVDIGLAPKPIGVGNLVFNDSNGDKRFTSGTDFGISGVLIELYSAGSVPGSNTPLAQTHSREGGLYELRAPGAGDYFMFIPAPQFSPGNGLFGGSVVTGFGDDLVPQDDNLSEDTLNASSPASTGVYSIPFTLAYGTEPTDSAESGSGGTLDDVRDADYDYTIDFGFIGIAAPMNLGVGNLVFFDSNNNGRYDSTSETGYQNSMDNFADSWGNMTIDLGFETAPAGFALAERDHNKELSPAAPVVEVKPAIIPQAVMPITFNSWKKDNQGSAEDDFDSDSATNLLEYALSTDPASGASMPSFSLIADSETDRVDAMIIRPSGGRADIRYLLSAKTDVRGTTWARLSLVPVITQNNNGSENVRYLNIANASIFAGSDLGLVRLEAQLDANLDGTPEVTATSSTQVWIRRRIAERMTFSMPLLKHDLFRGRITSVAGAVIQSGTQSWTSLLPANSQAYIEVTSGAHEGRRFEIDSSSTASTNLSLKGTLPTGLTGAVMALRTHWTVNELFADTLFTSGASAEDADRLLFFDNASNAYRTSWLAPEGWSGDENGTGIVAPGEGLMMHVHSLPVTITLTGSLRSNRFHLPLKVGAQLVGSGFPLSHSPVSLGLTIGNGFLGSFRASSAERLRLWEGDITEGAATYRSLFLQQHRMGSIWTQENDADQVDQSRAVLVAPSQALFLILKTSVPDFREP